MKRWIDIAYLVVLGATLGLVLTLGMMVAPVIFHANEYLQRDLLSHYQMGLLMSAIFLKSSYWLNFTALFIVLKEGYAYKTFDRDKIVVPSAATAILMIFLFTLYYTKEIISMQMIGESVVDDPTFQSLHKASEIDFGLLALSLLLLLGRRVYLLIKG